MTASRQCPVQAYCQKLVKSKQPKKQCHCQYHRKIQKFLPGNAQDIAHQNTRILAEIPAFRQNGKP